MLSPANIPPPNSPTPSLHSHSLSPTSPPETTLTKAASTETPHKSTDLDQDLLDMKAAFPAIVRLDTPTPQIAYSVAEVLEGVSIETQQQSTTAKLISWFFPRFAHHKDLWMRDNAIITPNLKIYIPIAANEDMLDTYQTKVRIALDEDPLSAKVLSYIPDRGISGNGFDRHTVKHIKQSVKLDHLNEHDTAPLLPLEGGNILQYRTQNGGHAAIVGEYSRLLVKAHMMPRPTYSTAYTDTTQLDFAVKENIAKALDISPANITFVPQVDFHIDMFMTVTPDGHVYINDDAMCLNELQELEQQPHTKKTTLEPWKQAAQKRYNHLQAQTNRIVDILTAAHIPVTRVPAVYESNIALFSEDAEHINLINGIFSVSNQQSLHMRDSKEIKEHTTFTALGPTQNNTISQHLVERFQAIMKANAFNYPINIVTNTAINGYLYGEGGLRCLTRPCAWRKAAS